jgi:hypothetical protein
VATSAAISLVVYAPLQWLAGWALWASVRAFGWIFLTMLAVTFGVALASTELKNLRRRLEGT